MARISSSEPRALGREQHQRRNGRIGMHGQFGHIAGAGVDQGRIGMAAGIGGKLPPAAAICRYRPSRSALFLLTTATRMSAQAGG